MCRIANESYKEEKGWQLVVKVHAFFAGKLAALIQRDEEVKNVNLGKGELDPLIFEVEEEEVAVKKEQVKPVKPKRAAPVIPDYQRYARAAGFWQKLAEQLPTSKTDEAQIKARRKLWGHFDLNGNGCVSLSETQAGMRHIDLPELQLREAKPAIARAFGLTKDLSSTKRVEAQKAPKNDVAQHFLDRAEFRAFLAAIRSHIVCQHAFKRLDAGGDGRIDRTEFLDALPILEQWTGKIDDAESVFKEIDADGAGTIRFAEFCAWAVRRELAADADDDSALEDV